jgi:hypothetical protein
MSAPRLLRVGWHREHFECPGGTGEMQVKLKNGEIDVCIGE